MLCFQQVAVQRQVAAQATMTTVHFMPAAIDRLPR
jgi:hypothetical protein